MKKQNKTCFNFVFHDRGTTLIVIKRYSKISTKETKRTNIIIPYFFSLYAFDNQPDTEDIKIIANY